LPERSLSVVVWIVDVSMRSSNWTTIAQFLGTIEYGGSSDAARPFGTIGTRFRSSCANAAAYSGVPNV
jgi:hypothetical protein